MPTGLDTEQLLLSVSAAAAIALVVKFVPRFLAGVPFVAPKDAYQKLHSEHQDAVVLDVREPGEFNDALGHIKGAINLPLGQVGSQLAKNQAALSEYQETPIYVVCRSAQRAAIAAKSLRKAGLKSVYVVSGGMIRWRKDGLPSSASR